MRTARFLSHVEVPVHNLIEIQDKIEIATHPRRGRNPGTGELGTRGLWHCCSTYTGGVRLRTRNNTDQTDVTTNNARKRDAKGGDKKAEREKRKTLAFKTDRENL